MSEMNEGNSGINVNIVMSENSLKDFLESLQQLEALEERGSHG